MAEQLSVARERATALSLREKRSFTEEQWVSRVCYLLGLFDQYRRVGFRPGLPLLELPSGIG